VAKVAADVTSNLQKYAQMLSTNQELAKLVPFRVVRRGANERARVTKALQSNICEDTVAVLHDNHQRWIQDPAAFWTGPSPCSVDSPDPHVQIVARSLQATSDNE
jgi:hypothetical protein